MAPPVAPTIALVSGLPLVVLGAWLLVLRPRRSEQVFFGLFTVLWGIQVVAANLGLVFDSARVFEAGFLIAHAVAAPGYLFLGQFVARVHGGRWAQRGAWLLAGLALVAGAVLVAEPSLVLENVTTQAGGLGAVELGPASFPLFFLPFFGVFYLALALLYQAYRRAPPGTERHRYRSMVLALALYTSYQAVTNLSTFSGFFLPSPLPPGVGSTLAKATFLTGTLLVLAIAFHLLYAPPEPETTDPILLGAFLLPAVVAVVTEASDLLRPEARSWGLWRLLAVGILVHAIARYRLFDLDLRLRRWAAPGLAVGVLALAGLVGLLRVAEEGALAAGVEPIGAGFALAGVLVVQRERVGSFLLPSVRDDPAYLEQRKHEVYQAACEGVVEAGDDPDDDPVLAELRAKMDVPESVHQAILAQIREPGSSADGRLPPIEPDADLLGRYRVDRLIGEGAHGRAFLAWDRTEEREVVLKVVGKPVLGGGAVERLRQEAEVLSRLDHPNVLTLYEVIEGRYEMVLVTEYASGGNLADLLARRGRLGLTRSLDVAVQVLRGLEAAHDAGVLHRDVKPENILLAEEGVRLADFGVAERSGEEGTALTAGPIGTLLYMSPEQVRGEPLDERSDLYAVGVVLHRILTGGFYISTRGADDFTLRQRILEHPPRLDLGDHPGAITAVLERALAKEPDARFPSAAAMREALETIEHRGEAVAQLA